MQVPVTPSRASSGYDVPTSTQNTSSDAALKGATLAFQGRKKDGDKPATPKPVPRTPIQTARNNGALLAATQASREHPTSPSPRSISPASATKGNNANKSNKSNVSRQTTGGSMQDTGYFGGGDLEHGGAAAPRLPYAAASSPSASSPYLSPSAAGRPTPDPKSASFIAATLAASRSASPSPRAMTGQAPPTAAGNLPLGPVTVLTPARIISRRTSVSSGAHSVSTSSSDLLDSTSIAPTNSLISMFETKTQDTDPVKRRDASPTAAQKLGTPPKIRPMTPPRTLSPKHPDEGPLEASNPKPKLVLTVPSTGDASVPTKSGPSAAAVRLKQQTAGFIADQAGAVQKPIPKPKPSQDKAPQVFAPAVTKRALTLPPEQEAVHSPATKQPLTTTNAQSKGPPVAPRGSGNQKPPSALGQVVPAEAETKVAVTQARARPPSQQKPPPGYERSTTPPPARIVRAVAPEVRSPQPKRIITNPTLEARPLLSRATAGSTIIGSETISPNKIIHNIASRQRPGSEMSQAIGAARPSSQHSTSSDDTFVSAASSTQSRTRSPAPDPDPSMRTGLLHRQPTMGQASIKDGPAPRYSSQYLTSLNDPPQVRRHSTSASTVSASTSLSNLPLDSLTSAIVASSLAASRSASTAPSPARNSPAPPPPRRHNHQAHQNHQTHHSPLHAATTGGSPNRNRRNSIKSPGRMLHTLRAPVSLSDDEDARRRVERLRKKHLGGKKHAHHEGSRHRWRDEITLRERRRYEAVWASNRGLFVDPAHQQRYQIAHGLDNTGSGPEPTREPEELVANVVVRDLWSRSRLPVDELAEVWDLVDRSGLGALSKHEFVVGMWLIDQRLRGRKLPARVGESVWDSARDLRFAGKGGKGGKGGKKK